MNKATLACQTEQRRRDTRRQGFNGLDYLEIEFIIDSATSLMHPVLRVYLLGKAPQPPDKEIKKENIRITGGRRIRDIRVLRVDICAVEDQTLDDCLSITLDKAGDFSTYTLCLVDDKQGRPTDRFFPGFDPRYTCLDFNFKDACLTGLDCKQELVCPPKHYPTPELNYLAKDYGSFRRLILDRLALIMPDWQETHVPDIGLTLVELLAYAGDYLSYYQDAVATEAYLQTARQRISVRRHARLVDYLMHEGCNARAWLSLVVSQDSELDPDQVYFITGYNQPRLGSSGWLTEAALNKELPWLTACEVFEPLLEARYQFRLADFSDLAGLANKLRTARTDVFARYIWGQISAEVQEALKNTGRPMPEALQRRLMADLNRLLQDVGLEVAARLSGLAVEPGETSLHGQALVQANRRLLEQRYGDYIHSSQLIRLYAGHNKIRFYTWGDRECCLPQGATQATLIGRLAYLPAEAAPAREVKETPNQQKEAPPPPTPSPEKPAPTLYLDVGDILIFEEVIGPQTGNPADADPTHRHVVRLTRVEPGKDPLYNQPVVEIEWAVEDALPFPLCLSVIGPAPYCEYIEDISLIYGNVILVDHGQRLPAEELGVVTEAVQLTACQDEGQVGETTTYPARFRPILKKGPLVFHQPLSDGAAASQLLQQDPRQALPWLQLTSLADFQSPIPKGQAVSNLQPWNPQYDLLRSNSQDAHVVVEVADDGRAHLRFGDGELGRQPAAGIQFTANYRVGGGPAGNVGAEAISHLILRPDYKPGWTSDGTTLQLRNPLPAQGGMAPEPMAEVKQFAPYAFRTRLQRAIIPQDYADLAMQHPKVQRAAAALRWSGSWPEILVVIDPWGQTEADEALLKQIKEYLYPYRRMGHEVSVQPARYVALEVVMEICVRPGYLQGHVKAALLERFSNRQLPNGQVGFFHPDNLTFGEGLALSQLVAAAQAVSGVESVTITGLHRWGATDDSALETGLLWLGPMEIVRLDNDSSRPENGELKLIMGGGR